MYNKGDRIARRNSKQFDPLHGYLLRKVISKCMRNLHLITSEPAD
jgi:hypothetical protein